MKKNRFAEIKSQVKTDNKGLLKSLEDPTLESISGGDSRHQGHIEILSFSYGVSQSSSSNRDDRIVESISLNFAKVD